METELSKSEEKSVREILKSHRENPDIVSRTAIKFEDQEWTYGEYIDECCVWADALLKLHKPDRIFHIGVLLDNGPDYCLALGAAGLIGAGVVGINPTRRGAELTRDIEHTDCEIILTESRYRNLLEHLEGDENLQIFSVDEAEWKDFTPAGASTSIPDVEIDPQAPYLLLFTSGTTGSPKAAICSQERLVKIGEIMCENHELTPADVCYQSMPMFHSNALMAGWIPCLAVGAVGAFRRRFSASNWLPDVQKFGATYFNYVGKPLTYILAVEESPEDKHHKLRRVFGNEGAVHDLKRFEERFGAPVFDSYGSTEGGLAISRTDDTPPAALGRADDFTKVLNQETGEESAVAIFDETGKLLNPEEAIGEMVHLKSHSMFEGYWNNLEAEHERTHDSKYWSGDLGYMDEDRFIYFAGRNFDWLRVDGENFAASPVEAILVRHPDVNLAAVYAVPNSDVGDDVMAAVVKRPGAEFQPEAFMNFLSAQNDMGIKWVPKYIRWADDLPKTPSMKILKRSLRNERWESPDETWILDNSRYRFLEDEDIGRIAEEFAKRGRESELQKIF